MLPDFFVILCYRLKIAEKYSMPLFVESGNTHKLWTASSILSPLAKTLLSHPLQELPRVTKAKNVFHNL